MSLAFVPLYIKFLGIESYGLIGIFASVQAMFAILDLGLSATLSREMARLSVLPNKEQEMRNLVRTLEVIYWLVAAFIGITVIQLSPFIAHQWVKAGQVSPQTIEQSLQIMGCAMALQWPASLYTGGVLGLQRQISLNAINIGMNTLRGAGAVLVLWLVSATIQSFFLWQIVISMASTLILSAYLWRILPTATKRAVFQTSLLAGVWKFAAGMSGLSILALILTQVDKVILSKMLTLEMFGYYTLASLMAMSLTRLYSPVFQSIYPKFTQLVATHNEDELKTIYHKSCQFFSLMILPVASVIVIFSHEIILLWTQSVATADQAHLLVSVLVCGTALNGIMNPPYALQLAYGWTRLNILVNVFGVVLLVPLTIYLTANYGAIGGASAWLAFNVGYALCLPPLMHKKLLPNEMRQWYISDVFIPLVVSSTAATLGSMVVNFQASPAMMFLQISLVYLIALIATVISLPRIRSVILSGVLTLAFKTQ